MEKEGNKKSTLDDALPDAQEKKQRQLKRKGARAGKQNAKAMFSSSEEELFNFFKGIEIDPAKKASDAQEINGAKEDNNNAMSSEEQGEIKKTEIVRPEAPIPGEETKEILIGSSVDLTVVAEKDAVKNNLILNENKGGWMERYIGKDLYNNQGVCIHIFGTENGKIKFSYRGKDVKTGDEKIKYVNEQSDFMTFISGYSENRPNVVSKDELTEDVDKTKQGAEIENDTAEKNKDWMDELKNKMDPDFLDKSKYDERNVTIAEKRYGELKDALMGNIGKGKDFEYWSEKRRKLEKIEKQLDSFLAKMKKIRDEKEVEKKELTNREKEYVGSYVTIIERVRQEMESHFSKENGYEPSEIPGSIETEEKRFWRYVLPNKIKEGKRIKEEHIPLFIEEIKKQAEKK